MRLIITCWYTDTLWYPIFTTVEKTQSHRISSHTLWKFNIAIESGHRNRVDIPIKNHDVPWFFVSLPGLPEAIPCQIDPLGPPVMPSLPMNMAPCRAPKPGTTPSAFPLKPKGAAQTSVTSGKSGAGRKRARSWGGSRHLRRGRMLYIYIYTHMLHIWNIYLHLPHKWPKCR